MKLRLIVAVVVLVVLATGAWAAGLGTLSPRAAAMGGAGIAVADDAAASFQNPAGLATLNVPCKDGAEFGNDLLFGVADQGDMNGWGLSWSGWKPSDNLGFGAFYADADFMGSAFGAAFGAGLKSTPLSAGVNIAFVNPDFGDSETVVNAGLLYRIPTGEGSGPLSLGLTVTDVFGELVPNPLWNIGLGWKPNADLLIAVDINDLSEEIGDVTFGGGIEYAFGGEQKDWRARVGALDNGGDTSFTAGVGYQRQDWRVDVSYIDTDVDGTWAFGIGVNL
ncbi:MAG: hypothetical protein KKI08_03230 [Armatimonadetes bacterium]|nr:hypothetical protein [Armatimonadota bacterium]